MSRVLPALWVVFTSAQCVFGQTTYQAGIYAGPVPSDGIKAAFFNDDGTFFLAGKTGTATYKWEGKALWSKLQFVRAASMKALDGSFIDQGVLYKDEKDPFHLFFSSQPMNSGIGTRYRLYYSLDGSGFSRWMTQSGTSKYQADERAIADFQQGGGPSTPGGNSTEPAPDGKKAVFPFTASESVNGGSADVTVLPEGIVTITMKGRHSGVSGSTKYSCAVVISGYRGGQPYTVLNRVETETLTVGANSLTGTASKTKTFTQSAAFTAEDRDNVRNVRVLLEKDKSGENFVDVVKGMLSAAEDIFDEAESLYKKIKQSEIGRDVATAAASG